MTIRLGILIADGCLSWNGSNSRDRRGPAIKELEQNLRIGLLVGRHFLSRSKLRTLDHFIKEMRIIIQVLMNIRKARMSSVIA